MTEIDTKEIHRIHKISLTSLVRRKREGRAPPVSNAPPNNVIVFSSIAIPSTPTRVSSDKTRNASKRERERERRKFYLTPGRGKIRCRFEGSKQSPRTSLLVTTHNVARLHRKSLGAITRSITGNGILLNLSKKKSPFLSCIFSKRVKYVLRVKYVQRCLERFIMID